MLQNQKMTLKTILFKKFKLSKKTQQLKTKGRKGKQKNTNPSKVLEQIWIWSICLGSQHIAKEREKKPTTNG